MTRGQATKLIAKFESVQNKLDLVLEKVKTAVFAAQDQLSAAIDAFDTATADKEAE